MPEQPLIISESEVRIAVIEYLKTKGIVVQEHASIHSRITFTRIGKSKHYHFAGYRIDDGEYTKGE